MVLLLIPCRADQTEIRIWANFFGGLGNIEWPAYLDIMTQTDTDWKVVPFNQENGFHPPNSDYFDRAGLNDKTHVGCSLIEPALGRSSYRCNSRFEPMGP